VTSTQIVEHLAQEFSTPAQNVRDALEMVDAGLTAPFVGRVRRDRTGGLSEGQVRRLMRRREELEELDRRRGTILRMLGAEASDSTAASEEPHAARAPAEVIAAVRSCMDRFELEDLFLPHRRPEPEVQLAFDRGLGRLADLLVEPLPPERRPQRPEKVEEEAHEHELAAEAAPAVAVELEAQPLVAAFESESSADAASDSQAATATALETDPEPQAGAVAEPIELAGEEGEAPAREPEAAGAEEALLHGQIELTPALARLCAPFVSPDRGVHTETEALSGAMRILSDRLGRDTRLRGLLRRMLRKQGVLSIRPVIDESKLGRHRSLLKLRQPLRQVQGHRLLAVRQAQKERAVQAVITLDRALALPKVRFALGRHTEPEHDSVLDAVALRALEYRLLPLLEADVRLELKERADEEALRFLAQHLRQILLAPGVSAMATAGLDVNAKGDWTLALIDERGALAGEPVRIETGEKDAAALGAELATALSTEANGGRRERARALAVGHGKAARAAVSRLRAAIATTGLDVTVLVVNEAGLSSYASSELARREHPELQVPQRMAVSLARRLQDPLAEIIKVDPRHLGLGPEQGLVSKANLKRALEESVESCVALVGCELASAPLALLERIPGLDREAARRLVERSAARPVESREELRAEGLLSEVQWMNAAAFLRVRGSEPFDATALHPEQYELARRLVEATGSRPEDSLGRPGVTRGLRRADFAVEEHTWRELMRELAWPGRDPRPRLFQPHLLAPDTDRAALAQGREIEGVVSNVASFGAFVDVGLEQDGMIHVSEISDRYVRDARELISIGQTVRVRVLDGSSPRVALSLKNVGPRPRPQPAPREGGAGRERGGERGERGERRGRGPSAPPAPVRAAQSRRDGLVTGRGGGGRGRDERGGGGRGGPGRGPGRGGPPNRGGKRDREDAARPEDLRAASSPKVAYNPFADFFKRGAEPTPPEAENEARP
jgi:protein Tex